MIPPLLAQAAVHPLAHVDAALNLLATVLLIVGYRLIRQGREQAHKRVMLTAFGVSAAFLVCYLTYHYQVGGVKFAGPYWSRWIYFPILISHIVLAALVPFLALAVIYLGLTDRRVAHRRLARWTWPIWLYVSITGVLVYAMLYHVWNRRA